MSREETRWPGLDHSRHLRRVLPLYIELLNHYDIASCHPERLKSFCKDPPCWYISLPVGISKIIGANQRVMVHQAWQAPHNRVY